MKPATVLGIILVILGIFALVSGGFSFTEHKRVADIGPIHADKNTTHSIPLPPLLGGIALVGGIILVAVGARSPRS